VKEGKLIRMKEKETAGLKEWSMLMGKLLIIVSRRVSWWKMKGM